MKFWKMNGAGNDFVIIDNIGERIPHEDLPILARAVCDRHFSVGADGLIVVGEASGAKGTADFSMLFFNSDGSIGEMCGNGARCIARYGFETGLSGGRETIVVETCSGLVKAKRISENIYRLRLAAPSLIETGKKFSISPDGNTGDPAENGNVLTLEAGYILLGDPGLPHLVTEYGSELRRYCGGDSLRTADRERLLKAAGILRHHPLLPKGANVSFYETAGPGSIEALTYERGVEDFTYACGTGAGCIALYLSISGLVSGSDIAIRMPGGVLKVDVEDAGKSIYLSGPSDIAAKGELFGV